MRKGIRAAFSLVIFFGIAVAAPFDAALVKIAAPLPQASAKPCGTVSVAERRLSVVWSGTRSARPSRLMIEAISPSA